MLVVSYTKVEKPPRTRVIRTGYYPALAVLERSLGHGLVRVIPQLIAVLFRPSGHVSLDERGKPLERNRFGQP